MTAHPPEPTYLLPPPRLVAPAEMPPHLGGVRLAAYTGERVDETEPFASDPVEDCFTPERASAVLKQVLATDAVRHRLSKVRIHPVGVSRRGEPAKGEPRRYLVVAYDYDANLAVEVTVDEASMDVVSVTESRSQPVTTGAEARRAVSLARADGRVGDVSDLVAHTIQVEPPEELGGPEGNHRVVEVLFSCPGERLPRVRAWVDLSTEQVSRVAEVGSCCRERGDR